MADKLEILITAKDQASDVLNGIKGSLSNTAGLLTGAVAGGAAIAASAIAGIGVAAFGVASDMKDTMNQMKAQLGLTADEAYYMGNVVKEVFKNNLGESIEDVGAAVGTVAQKLGDLGVTSPADIQDVTEAALALRDVFGFEVSESMESVRALMDNFGITGQEAMDLITSGMQDIPAFAADGLDTINEYAGLFADAGFSAAQMYSIMESGAATGVLGTDKIADAMKEMGIIFNEGGEEVSAAFSTIGLSFEEIQASVASGDSKLGDYFDSIVDGINDIEDPIERSAAQVAIFGTMAEDLGVSFTEGLTSAGATLADFEGAADSLNVKYDSLGMFFQGLWRQIQVGLMPVGEIMLSLANIALPYLQSAFETVFGAIQTALQPFIAAFDTFPDLLSEIDWSNFASSDLTDILAQFGDALGYTREEAGQVAEAVFNIVEVVQTFIAQAQEVLAPIAEWIAEFVSWKDILIVLGGAIAATVIPAIISIVTAIAPVLLAIGAAIAVVAVLRNAWENNWGGIQDKVKAVIDFLVPLVNNAINNIRQWWADNGQQIMTNVQNAWNTIMNVVNTVGQAIGAFIQDLLGRIRQWWADHGESVVATVTGFINLIRTVIETVLNTIRTLWENHGQTVLNFLRDIWNAIVGEIQSVLDFFGGIFDAFALAFEGDWEGFWQTIKQTLINRLQDMVGALMTATETLRGIVSDWVQSVIDKFQSIDWGQLGRNMIEGILNGLINAQNMIMDWITGLAQRILEGILNFFSTPFSGQSLPQFAGQSALPFPANPFPAVVGGGETHTHYHLTVNSNQSVDDVAQDFWMMRAFG